MQLTHRDVEKILQIVDGARSLGDIEFVHNGLHFRFIRDAELTPQAAVRTAWPPSSRSIQSEQFRDPKITLIRATTVGRFYRSFASSHGALIEIGTRVQSDKTIAVIETAMRTTAVEARVDGLVKHIFPNDGEFVEFDQPLFIVAVT